MKNSVILSTFIFFDSTDNVDNMVIHFHLISSLHIIYSEMLRDNILGAKHKENDQKWNNVNSSR